MKFCASNLILNQVNQLFCLKTSKHLQCARTVNTKRMHNGHVLVPSTSIQVSCSPANVLVDETQEFCWGHLRSRLSEPWGWREVKARKHLSTQTHIFSNPLWGRTLHVDIFSTWWKNTCLFLTCAQTDLTEHALEVAIRVKMMNHQHLWQVKVYNSINPAILLSSPPPQR